MSTLLYQYLITRQEGGSSNKSTIFEGVMDNKEIRIKIDPNGNVQREIVDRTEPEERKPKLLKRLVTTLSI